MSQQTACMASISPRCPSRGSAPLSATLWGSEGSQTLPQPQQVDQVSQASLLPETDS